MAVKVSPFGPKPQFLLASGLPAVGNQLFFYVAGSVNSKQSTYTDSTGGSANTNPIVLNALGEPTTEIWFTAGQSYKVVYAPSTDTDPPTSPIWSIDNLTGINDTTTTSSEWVAGPAPTFIGATSFSLVGDQTSTFTPGRRLKFTVTAGTVYGTIYTSVFGAITTVTMAMDSSGNLDSGLSAVSYGFLASTNPSIPSVAQQTIASAATVNLASARGESLHISGATGPITSFGNAPSGMTRTVVFDSTPTITHNATSLILPGAANIVAAAGDVGVFVSEGAGNWRCVEYSRATGGNVSGGVVQRVYAEYTTNADLTTTIPADDTIPQITEGTEIITVTITPKSASNTIRVRFQGWGSCAGAETWAAALFVDATANALAAAGASTPVATNRASCGIEIEFSAASTTARTYRLRVGPAGGNALRLNGNAAGRLFGAVARATLIAEEVA